jgi:hypothetical protein
MVKHSNSLLLEAIEGATIVAGDMTDDDGMTLYLADGRCLMFVSNEFAVMLKRLSRKELH